MSEWKSQVRQEQDSIEDKEKRRLDSIDKRTRETNLEIDEGRQRRL